VGKSGWTSVGLLAAPVVLRSGAGSKCKVAGSLRSIGCWNWPLRRKFLLDRTDEQLSRSTLHRIDNLPIELTLGIAPAEHDGTGDCLAAMETALMDCS
jgi:hypothetical protein